MDYRRFDATFEEFLQNIALTQSQVQRIDSSVNTFSTIFSNSFSDVDMYAQGSFATGTTVKPLTAAQNNGVAGEYDIDIVLERPTWSTARTSLEEVSTILSQYEAYSHNLSNDKESCVRVYYSPESATNVGFHVDLVPLKRDGQSLCVARRTADRWEESDSPELISWTDSFLSEYPFASATLLTLKRMRDLKGLTAHITSIVLFSLLNEHYQERDSYLSDILSTLETINNSLDNSIDQVSITNPISDEDIITKWRDDERLFEELRQFFIDAHKTLTEAAKTGKCSDFQSILSDDFPSELLSDNVDSTRSQGYSLDTSGKLREADITANSTSAQRFPNNKNKIAFSRPNEWIRFVANDVKAGEKVLWQVNNARGSDQPRGDFFESKVRTDGDKRVRSDRQHVNDENEKYLGEHWIRYICVDPLKKVTAVSRKFRVFVSYPQQRMKPSIQK